MYRNIFSALEYDEIWTLENFSNLPVFKLLTELALPNNQPLNSLFVKLTALLNAPVWTIRLHSLIAALLTLPLTGSIAYILSGKSKIAGAACMFFMALSAPDIAYATLARGYALQVYFLALYGAGLASTGSLRPTGKISRYLPECVALFDYIKRNDPGRLVSIECDWFHHGEGVEMYHKKLNIKISNSSSVYL